MSFRNMFGNAMKWYNHCLTTWPITTNATTGFTIACGGDVACQYYEQVYDRSRRKIMYDNNNNNNDSNEKIPVIYNWRRALEMGLIRAIVIVPFITIWYPFIARTCPGTSILRVCGRVTLDQAIGSPTVIVLVFFSNACLQGDPFSSFDRILKHGVDTWIAGLYYWPIVHSFNFGFVPLQHQPLYAHVASLYWNAILSYYSNIEMAQPKEVF